MSATLSIPLPEADRIAVLTSDLERTKNELGLANMLILSLKEQLRLERIRKYGPASEKFSDAQLRLLDLEPGVSAAEVQAESEREPIETAARRKRKKHPGRQQFPPNVPRVEKIIACTPEQCTCGVCGQPTEVIGYDESQQLDVEPAKFFVLVTKREKRACKCCPEGGVAAAPLPPRIVEKGLVSDRVVIDTVVNKYCDHLPLYRQSVILEREAGIEIGRATLDGWVMQVGGLLVPVSAAMRHELVFGNYIQADETPVDVQTHEGRGKNHQAYLWQYGSPRGTVVFDFRMGRGREGPQKFLGQFGGILQTDGYVAYESDVGGPGLVHAVCWAHSRRKFMDALKVNESDKAAAAIVFKIDALFAIDREARERGLDHAARHVLRTERAVPLVAEIKPLILAAQLAALPSSTLGKAASYPTSGSMSPTSKPEVADNKGDERNRGRKRASPNG
jgi:transposase